MRCGNPAIFEAHTKAFYRVENGPGAIAAFLLGLATRDSSNTAKAKELFLWQRATLFDQKTGRVADSINHKGKVTSFALTYNQGTFVGAANLLDYHDGAKLAALFTMNNLCKDGYLPASGETGDGGGFNGIGVRWIARYMKDRREQPTFEPWLQKNAEAAWQARRAEDNLSWCAWPKPTPPGIRHAWGSSNADGIRCGDHTGQESRLGCLLERRHLKTGQSSIQVCPQAISPRLILRLREAIYLQRIVPLVNDRRVAGGGFRD